MYYRASMIKKVAGIVFQIASFVFISLTFSIGLSAFPSAVAADVISVQTQQLLPLGSNTCAPLSAYNFTPYIYDGALHSFEFSIPDKSYVALAGTVGNTSIPFQFMTRRGDSSDALQVHIDIQTTPIQGMLPLSVTLLSAGGSGQPVCMSVAIMATPQGPSVEPFVPITGNSSTIIVPQTQVQPMGIPPSIPTISDLNKPLIDVTDNGSAEVPSTSSPVKETGALAYSVSMLSSIQDKIVTSCALTGNASRLWVILLAMYLAVVAIAVLVQTSMYAYSIGQRSATILTPLVLLLGFWYLTETCRATPWAPVATALIAVVGLLSLYRNDSRLASYIGYFKTMLKTSDQLSFTDTKDATNKPMITPPPTKMPGA